MNKEQVVRQEEDIKLQIKRLGLSIRFIGMLRYVLRVMFWYTENCNTQQVFHPGGGGCRSFHCHHYVVLWQGCSLFKSKFSTECDLVLPLSNFSTFFSSGSSSSCLCRLPILLVPSTFPSMTCFRRQFLRKVWPIQVFFILSYVEFSFLP
jgi:hypothetical protein